MLHSVLNRSEKQHFQNISCIATYLPFCKPTKKGEQDIPNSTEEAITNMDRPALAE